METVISKSILSTLKDLAIQQARELGLGNLTFISFNPKNDNDLEIIIDSNPDNLDLFNAAGNGMKKFERLLENKKKFWLKLLSEMAPYEGWDGNKGHLVTIRTMSCSNPKNQESLLELNGKSRKFFMPSLESFVVMADSLKPEERQKFHRWGMFSAEKSACFQIPLETITKIEIVSIDNDK